MNDDRPVTARRLEMVLIDREVSQEDLADALGVSQSAISQIITGKTRRSRLIPQIARFFSIDLDWFMGDGEDSDVIGRSAGKDSKREVGSGQIGAVSQSRLSFSGASLDLAAGTPLGPEAEELLRLFLGMPGDFQEAVLIHVRSMYGALARRGDVPPPPEPTPLPPGGVQDRAGFEHSAWVYRDDEAEGESEP